MRVCRGGGRGRYIDQFSFGLQTKTDEPNVNRASAVLIGSANTRPTCVSSYVHLTLCFDILISRDNKIIYTAKIV